MYGKRPYFSTRSIQINVDPRHKRENIYTLNPQPTLNVLHNHTANFWATDLGVGSVFFLTSQKLFVDENSTKSQNYPPKMINLSQKFIISPVNYKFPQKC